MLTMSTSEMNDKTIKWREEKHVIETCLIRVLNILFFQVRISSQNNYTFLCLNEMISFFHRR